MSSCCHSHNNTIKKTESTYEYESDNGNGGCLDHGPVVPVPNQLYTFPCEDDDEEVRGVGTASPSSSSFPSGGETAALQHQHHQDDDDDDDDDECDHTEDSIRSISTTGTATSQLHSFHHDHHHHHQPEQQPMIPHSFFSNRLTFRRLIVRPCITFLVGAILFRWTARRGGSQDFDMGMVSKKNFQFTWTEQRSSSTAVSSSSPLSSSSSSSSSIVVPQQPDDHQYKSNSKEDHNHSLRSSSASSSSSTSTSSSKYVLLPSPYHSTRNTPFFSSSSSSSSLSSTSYAKSKYDYNSKQNFIRTEAEVRQAQMMQQQFAYPTVPTSWSAHPLRTSTNGKDVVNTDTITDDDDDDDDGNDDDSDSTFSAAGGGDANTNTNVAKYGWDPTLYPNPILQPNQCGIAYLLDHYSNGDPIRPSPNDGGDDGNSTSSTTTLPSSELPLRLCDPDWVLGGVYLEEIAQAMNTFSQMFATYFTDIGYRTSHFIKDSSNTIEVGNEERGSTMSFPFRGVFGPKTTGPTESSDQPPGEQEEDDEEASTEGEEEESKPEDNPKLSNGDAATKVATSTAPPFEFVQIEAKDSRTANRNNDKQHADPVVVAADDGKAHTIHHDSDTMPTVELAIATVRSMNVPATLRQGSYYTYEDEDDMVNDAAQLFARYLHSQWWSISTPTTPSANSTSSTSSGTSSSTITTNNNYGILIFMSIQDRVCFISTGMAISQILPWWRLEHVVASMKPDLRRRDYGHAILAAIDDLTEMLEAGPPTFQDRLHDFLTRFGVVIAFAVFTFVFGAWGEYRDRRKRWQYAESRSKLNPIEYQKARLLQKGFHTSSCPICLETFDYDSDLEVMDDHGRCSEHCASATEPTEASQLFSSQEDGTTLDTKKRSSKMKRVDSMGIPLCGVDKKRIKILRCGHIFCETCWKGWVHSGHGNPCICPVCRQDVGGKASGTKSRSRRSRRQQAIQASSNSPPQNDTTPLLAAGATSASLARGHTSYGTDSTVAGDVPSSTPTAASGPAPTTITVSGGGLLWHAPRIGIFAHAPFVSASSPRGYGDGNDAHDGESGSGDGHDGQMQDDDDDEIASAPEETPIESQVAMWMAANPHAF